MNRFAELCRRLGGEFLEESKTLKCIIMRSEWFPSRDDLKMVTDMIREAMMDGKDAVISFGNKLLGGWWEGVSISLRGGKVIVGGNVYSSPLESRFVEDVIDATIEREIWRDGVKMRVEAYVDENPATDEYAGSAEVATEGIDVGEISPERLEEIVNAVISEAEEYADLALEKLVIGREEI